MYYGQITTALDFDFTKSINRSSFVEEVMRVHDIDVSRFRADLQLLQLRLIDDASLKKVEYRLSGQEPRGRFESDRTVKVPLNTSFPEANKAIIVGYDFVADASSGGENGVLTIHGKVNVKLRDYKEHKLERKFDMNMPIGRNDSVKCGLIGRIAYFGSSDEGTRIVREVYDVLHGYDSDFEKKRLGITPEVQANIAKMLKETDDGW
ncbi:MAG: hypothetical protein AABW80_02740 [Nanoarchaeota archaeon]